MALKKQSACLKELKKMAQDEKKRADMLERKMREGSSTPPTLPYHDSIKLVFLFYHC